MPQGPSRRVDRTEVTLAPSAMISLTTEPSVDKRETQGLGTHMLATAPAQQGEPDRQLLWWGRMERDTVWS